MSCNCVTNCHIRNCAQCDGAVVPGRHGQTWTRHPLTGIEYIVAICAECLYRGGGKDLRWAAEVANA